MSTEKLSEKINIKSKKSEELKSWKCIWEMLGSVCAHDQHVIPVLKG